MLSCCCDPTAVFDCCAQKEEGFCTTRGKEFGGKVVQAEVMELTRPFMTSWTMFLQQKTGLSHPQPPSVVVLNISVEVNVIFWHVQISILFFWSEESKARETSVWHQVAYCFQRA